MIEQLDRTAAIEAIYTCLIHMQRNHDYVCRGYISEFTLFDNHLMVEILADANLVASDLVKMLRVDKVYLSRALARLEAADMLRMIPEARDKRRKNILISEHGKQTLQRMDAVANVQMQKFCRRLSLAEQGRLRDQFDNMATALDIPPSALRADEHHLRRGIRRFTRAVGLLSDTVFGISDCSSLNWHVLVCLDEADDAMASADIAAYVPAPLALVANTLQRFLQRGWITQAADTRDRRKLLSKITQAGLTELAAIKKRACEIFVHGTQQWSDEELREFAYLCGCYASEGLPDTGSAVLQESIAVHRLTAANDLREARIFLIRELPGAGFPAVIPTAIIDPKNAIFALTQNGSIAAVLELPGNNPQAAPIFAVGMPRIDQDLMSRFIAEARNLAAQP